MSSSTTESAQSLIIPNVRLGISLPNGLNNVNSDNIGAEKNWNKPNYIRGESIPTDIALIDQTFDIRVYLFPLADNSIFNLNPELFLFRDTNRINKTAEMRFVADGNQIVHPTNYIVGGNITGHRYYGGSQSGASVDRITEIPLKQSGDFYGGDSTNPHGTVFPFRPIAWFSNANKIIADSVTFPQPLYNNSATGNQPYSGIEIKLVHYNGSYYYMKYGADKYRYNKAKLTFQFYIGLMIDNPNYDGGTKIAKKILISNLVPFCVGFKRHTFKDSDGVLKKFAVDWNIKQGYGSAKF